MKHSVDEIMSQEIGGERQEARNEIFTSATLGTVQGT